MGNLYLYHFAKQAFGKFHLLRPNSSKMSRLGKFFLSYHANKLKNFSPYMVYFPKTFLKNLFEMLIN